MAGAKIHLLSVNLEDYFQVAPLRQVIPHRHWPRFSLRIERSTLATLDLLDKHLAKATFFTLGWLAERCPDLVKEVANRGHEVASKGYHHRPFSQMSGEEFRDDYLRSRDAIERATGRSVLGYRIAEGGLPTDTLEPFRTLAEAGVRYDSSVRPFGAAFIGKPEWRRPQKLHGDGWSITEVPLSSSLLCGVPVPVTGGNYLRQIPGAIYDNRLAAYLRHSNDPWHFYFHVWEMDPEQPRISAVSSVKRMRQYRNLGQMRDRVESYLGEHRFQTIADYLQIAPVVATPLAPSPKESRAGSAARNPRKNVSIVVPCYNEEATLPYLAGTLASFAEQNSASLNLTTIFVDDGSADRTWEVLQNLFGDRADCILVQHPKNRGIAAATMTGLRRATDEIVCGIDCDCSFDPHTLADMIPLLEDGVDMVQASPYHPDGGVANVPAWRLVLSRTLSRIYRRVLNHKFASYTACFRVYRRSTIEKLVLENEGFLGIAELFIRLDQQGGRIVEFPTVLESRLIGVSKMKTLSVIGAHLKMLARLGRTRFGPAAVETSANPRSEEPRPASPSEVARHPTPERWCIVGGGMLGLSLAHRLAAPGREITVMEAGDRFGGLADAWRIGPYCWDRHYHVTLLSDLNLRGLLTEIGLEGELKWTTTKTDFYTDGQFYPLNDVIDYLRFRPLGLIDKARLAATILYASSIRNGTRLESIPVGQWLTRLSGERVYERIWKPLLRAKLGDNHRHASASFIWSVINRFYAARRSGLQTEMFGYVSGGYSQIVDSLVGSLKARSVRCLTGQAVRQIARAGGKLRVATATGEADYDRVIVTAPGPIAARMCPQLGETELARLSALRYQGVVCASVLLRKPLRNRYLTYIADETLPLTGVIEMTAVVDRAEFGGNTLVYLPQYVPSDDPLFEVPDAELQASRMAALQRMFPSIEDDDVLAFRISRARNVLAIQDLNYSRKAPAMRTSIPGLHIVNSAQIINGNLNVDETIALANRAAAELEAANPIAPQAEWYPVGVAAE